MARPALLKAEAGLSHASLILRRAEWWHCGGGTAAEVAESSLKDRSGRRLGGNRSVTLIILLRYAIPLFVLCARAAHMRGKRPTHLNKQYDRPQSLVLEALLLRELTRSANYHHLGICLLRWWRGPRYGRRRPTYHRRR